MFFGLAETMAPSVSPMLLSRLSSPAHYAEPLWGKAISQVLSLVSITVLSVFLAQRCVAIRVWRRLPFVMWLVFAIFIDSYMFVAATAVLERGFGVNSSLAICSGAILLCLSCYVTTKLIYLFLVEKAHIIRGSPKPRMKSRLYIFNSVGMLGVYAIVVILNFVFRINRIEDGQCVIGMQRSAMIPLISFDAVVNIYLTILFMIPLSRLYSFKNTQRTPSNMRLRTIATRTFIGAVSTLVSSIANLAALMALDGEPGWICLMCCNCDILFSVLVIQWVTAKDNAASGTLRSQDRLDEAPLPLHMRRVSSHSAATDKHAGAPSVRTLGPDRCGGGGSGGSTEQLAAAASQASTCVASSAAGEQQTGAAPSPSSSSSSPTVTVTKTTTPPSRRPSNTNLASNKLPNHCVRISAGAPGASRHHHYRGGFEEITVVEDIYVEGRPADDDDDGRGRTGFVPGRKRF